MNGGQDLQQMMRMQEHARIQIEEKLQAIQRDLFVRLVLQCSDMPDDEELMKLAVFSRRASVQYGKAIGFLKETKPAEHKMRAEAGKIVAGPS